MKDSWPWRRAMAFWGEMPRGMEDMCWSLAVVLSMAMRGRRRWLISS